MGVFLAGCESRTASIHASTDAAPAAGMPVFQELQEKLEDGMTALERGDTASYVSASAEVYAAGQFVPAFIYHQARALALVGGADSALVLLNVLAREGATVAAGFADDPAFSALRDTPAMQRAVEAWASTRQRISNATEAFEVDDTLLVPEGTAFDNRTGDVLLGSINRRKIIRRARDGTIRDAVPSGSNGLGAVGGIKVDAERRHLWAVSLHQAGHPSAGDDATLIDAGVLYRFDVDRGAFLRRYVVPAAVGEAHGFNDVTVLPNGDAYTTDNRAGAVYVVRAATDSIEPVFPPRTFTFPNGIAHTPDGSTLFIAHAHGVEVVRLADLARWRLAVADSINIAGFDGLTFAGTSLIGHQPSSFNRIVRLELSDDLRAVMSRHILERHHPRFSQPTTGALGNDGYYYFIANAQMRRFRERTEPMEPTLVLRLRLPADGGGS